MSEPTQYDLVQDKRLDTLTGLVTPLPKARSGYQYSFPIVGQDVSDSEFQQMMLSTAAGVLDQGGRPFWLKNFDNASRTAQLTVSTTTKDAKAAMNGFFYRLLQDMPVSFPMPSKKTTYHVCLTYDPLGHSRVEGPISVRVYSGPPTYSNGLMHVELWEVECSPSQLLSDAKVTQKRPKVSPSIHVDYRENMPDPRAQLWGATCYIRYGSEKGTTYIATGESEETGGPTRWEELTTKSIASKGSTDTYRWHSAFIERDGKRRRAYGRVFRTNGRPFGRTSNGWRVWFFEQQDRPRSNFYFAGVVAGSWKTSPAFAKVTFEPDALVLWPDANESNYFDFNGMEWWVD